MTTPTLRPRGIRTDSQTSIQPHHRPQANRLSPESTGAREEPLPPQRRRNVVQSILSLSARAPMSAKLAISLPRVSRNIKVLSGNRTRIGYWPCTASQPTMRQKQKMAQREEIESLLRIQHRRVLTCSRQKARAIKPCESIGSARARCHKPSGAPLTFHVLIYLTLPLILCYYSHNLFTPTFELRNSV